MTATLMKHAAWLTQTSVFGTTRSDELVAVDAALARYEKTPISANLVKLKDAFIAWKGKASREGNWFNSARNKRGAVTAMELALFPSSPVAKARDEPGMQNAREGVLFLFSNLDVRGGWVSAVTDGGVSLANGLVGLNQTQDYIGTAKKQLISAVAGEAAGRSTDTMSSGILAIHKARKEKMSFGDVMSAIWDWASDFARNAVHRLYETFRMTIAHPLDGLSSLLDYGEAAVKLAMGYLMPKLAPLVGAGIDMFEGLRETGSALIHRFNAWYRQRKVQFVSGHPAVIFSQIETAMSIAAGKGLWSMLKGAGSFTGEFLSFGATSIISLLVSAAELIAKLILRYVEQRRMRSFFASCKPLWQEVRIARASGDGSTSRFVKDPVGFGHWYQEASFAMPCLSMLALKSGIVGDKMRMIEMFTGRNGNQVIKGKDFASGTRYIDGLKSWGMKYLDETGFKFTSTDKMVGALINRPELRHSMREVSLADLGI